MTISPQRRQRILQAHHMREQGASLRKIGKTLGVSHTTIVDDLKLLESRWSDVVDQAADDALLEQLQLLILQLRSALPFSMSKAYGHLPPAEFARIYLARSTELATLLREIRRTAAALHDRAAARRADAEQPDLELPFPDDELARPARPAKQRPAESPDQPLPQPSKSDHQPSAIPSPGLKIVAPDPSEKHSDQPPNPAQPDRAERAAQLDVERAAQLDAELDQALAEAAALLQQIDPQPTPAPPSDNGAAA